MPNYLAYTQDIQDSLSRTCTEELRDALLREYDELNERFYLGDFRPSELSGARFGEVVFRICEHVCTGSYTALDKNLPKTDVLIRTLEQTPSTKASDSFRLHIPRTLRLIYDFRSKRDVAHLGKGVSPNYADASLVLICANWILAEIVRIGHKCDIAVAQVIVDNLVERRTSLLWQEGDVVRVLKPSLTYRQQVLLLLHHFQPARIADRQLCDWIEYSNFSLFKNRVLRQLHDDALIDYRGGRAVILPTGNKEVELTLRA